MFRSLVSPHYFPPMTREIEVEIVESALKEMLDTVGSHPPETVGMFGGDLNQPNRILKFRFCPPNRKTDGSYDRSRGHINVDAEYMNFVIDEEWKPKGLYLLGMAHSHPTGITSLSYGDEARNEGDVVFFKNCLQHDDSPGRKWKTCFAPIITFGKGGEPQVHWYAVTLDDPDPIRVIAHVIPDPKRSGETEISSFIAKPAFPIDELLQCHRIYQGKIQDIERDESLSDETRELALEQVRLLWRHDTSEKVQKITTL